MKALKTIHTELSPALARHLLDRIAAPGYEASTAAERHLMRDLDSVSRHIAMAGTTRSLRLPVPSEAAGLFNRVLADLLSRARERSRHERVGVYRILIDAGVFRFDPDATEADARRTPDTVIRYRRRLYAFHSWLAEAEPAGDCAAS